MTVHAGAGDQLVARDTLETVSFGVRCAWMECGFVAALAELGGLPHQQVVVVRSMDQMAVQTVCLDRRMFESEGASLLGMAFVAELVHGLGPEHLGAKGAVCVMTGRARDLAFTYRVVGLLVCLQPDVLMTGEAEVRLFRLQALATAHMDRVAVTTRDAV